MSESVKVVFQPEGRKVFVLKGSLLIEAAVKAGIPIVAPCGGKGTCGKCRVSVPQGAPEPTAECKRHLSADELRQGVRLACQMRVIRDAVVEIPTDSRLFAPKILIAGEGRKVVPEPDVRKIHMRLPKPSLEDQRADNVRLIEALAQPGAWIPLTVLRDMPAVLRKANFEVTAVVAGDEVLDVEPGDTSDKNYGMAFDVGTTTVVGFLLEVNTGAELAVASRTNPQVAHGDDVVNRIGFAETAEGLRTLQTSILGTMNEIVAECCESAGVGPGQIYEIAVAGNTAMNHLLLGIDPSHVAQAPYVAALRDALDTPAAQLGVNIHGRGNVHTLPNVAGFVGGDTVGMVLATDMMRSEEPILAIDIGTNGELVVGDKRRLVSCSTAAGPALEGARIRFGMRAAPGAIDRVAFDGDVRLNVIGGANPTGICGSAVIDALAEMLRVGVVDTTGRLLSQGEAPADLPAALRERIREVEGGLGFVLAYGDGKGEDIVFTQRDIREVQLAKGAIAAGTRILLEELGIGPDGLKEILLAGAFGNFIRRSNALRIGLLPDVPHERIRFVGNAAGAGAKMALLSRSSRAEAVEISERTEYMELAGRPDFQMHFAEAMLFPEIGEG